MECKNLHGKIWRIDEKPEPEPPLHPSCRCVIENMESIEAGTATMNGTDGADWTLKQERTLPNYYVSEEDLKSLGWRRGDKPSEFSPNKMFSGGKYRNKNNHLPQIDGRVWYEADVNYKNGKRNSQRVLWSNDGLVFVTYDHYATFYEIV